MKEEEEEEEGKQRQRSHLTFVFPGRLNSQPGRRNEEHGDDSGESMCERDDNTHGYKTGPRSVKEGGKFCPSGTPTCASLVCHNNNLWRKGGGLEKGAKRDLVFLFIFLFSVSLQQNMNPYHHL